MKVTDSLEKLITKDKDNINEELLLNEPIDRPLSQIEKTFLLHAERGDCATVKK